MPRIALVLPATTYRAGAFLDAAARAGSDVVIASDQRQALAQAMGDRALRIDLRDASKAAARLAAHGAHVGLDAVVGVEDVGAEVAAEASALLGLPHNPVTSVRATRDKALLRAALDGASDVQQPAWMPAQTSAEARRAAAFLGLPVVVKPVALSASRGVIRADTPQQAAQAAARALRIAAEAGAPERLVVERFAPGQEVAVEGLVRRGELEVLAVFDKPDPLDGPYFEETLYVTPSRLPASTMQEVLRSAQAAVSALGLVEGPVHAEMRVNDGQATLLEAAARTIGGLCGRALRFGMSMSLEDVVVRHALGLPLHALAREDAAAGAMMLPIPHSGVLRSIEGSEDAARVPGIEDLAITVPVGARVAALPEADRYLGFLIAREASPERVESALREAHSRLRIDIEADCDDSPQAAAPVEPDPTGAQCGSH